MTINERVQHLRKNLLHLSQADMAKKLGMKQTGISYMERTTNAVTEQNIKSICLIFNINEDWLRYGCEPIFAERTTFSLDAFAEEKGATSLDIEIVKAYLDLDPSIRKHVLEHFKKYLSYEKNISEKYTSISDSSSDFEKKYSSLEEGKQSSVG